MAKTRSKSHRLAIKYAKNSLSTKRSTSKSAKKVNKSMSSKGSEKPKKTRKSKKIKKTKKISARVSYRRVLAGKRAKTNGGLTRS